MALLPPLIRLNKKLFTRNSIAIRLNGALRITDVDSIDWSDEAPHDLVDAMNDGGAPIGKVRMKYACEATIGIYADAASAWELAILAANPQALGDLTQANFQLLITMTEDIRSRVVTLIDCNIVGRPSRTVGNDGNAIVSQYKLQPMQVRENGLSLLNNIPAI
jgi:hypothetical protein